MTAPPLLEVENAEKAFRVASLFGRTRTVEALRGVSFRLDQGKALALVGESGSGKSTCARAIAGLVRLSSGRILFRGRDISAIRRRSERLAYARAVQMVFQDPYSALNPTHTVRHHLSRPLRLHRHGEGDAETAIRACLRDVELDADATIGKYPHELSGGERQRVNLARALAVGAELIVADEPTSMLDMSIRRSVLDLMRWLRDDRGIAFLLITHDIATAASFADEIAVVFAGRIVERGPPAEMIDDPRHPYTRLLISALPRPGRRLASGEAGRDFAAMADTVRARARESKGKLVEFRPGHFVSEGT